MLNSEFEFDHGHVAIAAITSCTNTSNPSVMIGAGLLAQKANKLGLKSKAMGKNIFSSRIKSCYRLFNKIRTSILFRQT